MKHCIILSLLGAIFAIVLPEEEFLRTLFLIALALFILFLYINLAKNARIYQKVFSCVAGFLVGSFVYWQRWGLLVDILAWQGQILWVILGTTLAVMFFCTWWVWRQEAEKRISGKLALKEWKDRNLFWEREADLNRLTHYVKEERMDVLGIEGEWGSGKTFLVEGLKERLQKEDDYELLTVDVMAIRLDRYADYLVRELDGVLRRNGTFSENSTTIRQLLAESKFKALSFLWTDVETQYTKLFDDFREELLSLHRRIVIIYEDLDRINQVDGIRDIFYLSEKLTAQNRRWTDSSIQIVYQYSARHMQELGFHRLYLEKYIHCRMQLTKIDFVAMVRKLQQQENDRCQLSDDDLYRLPPHFILPRSRPILEEERWIEEYFSDKFTIRRTKQFLQELEIKMGEYSSRMEDGERDLVVAMCFIEYFLPEAYGKLDVENLPEVFVLREEGWLSFARACKSKWMLFEPQKHEQNFEMYMAWRMLGLDAVKGEKAPEVQDVSDFYGWSMEQVVAARNLKHVNVQQMVRFFYESGKPFWNVYICQANRLVEQVFSKERRYWPTAFQRWQQDMNEEQSGVETLQRIGVSLWTELVRAFGFASSKWTQEEKKTNYQNLIILYQMLRDETGNDLPRFFGQRFMEDWIPVWEGMPQDAMSFRMMFDMVCPPKTIENYQHYDLFYVFAGRSMMALYQNGFAWQTEPWMYAPLFQKGMPMEKKKECLEECLGRIDREVEHLCITLQQVETWDPLPGTLPMYRSAQKYFSFLRKSLRAKRQAKIQQSSHVMTKIIDVTGETLEKIQNIEDDARFYEAIHENQDKVAAVSLIDLIRRRNDKGK